MISLIFNHSSVILIFSKFLLEIFASLKSFQLIDSFIPWLKLVGATGNEISSWLIQCKLRKKRWKRKPSLSCRDIHPGKEEDEWRGNRSKEVSLSLSPDEGKSYTVFFLYSGNGLLHWFLIYLVVCPFLFRSFFTGVRNLFKFQFISRDFRCLNITKLRKIGHPIS